MNDELVGACSAMRNDCAGRMCSRGARRPREEAKSGVERDGSEGASASESETERVFRRLGLTREERDRVGAALRQRASDSEA